jgi:hypothetical protein
MPNMSRTRVNRNLAFTIGVIVTVIAASILLKEFLDTRARVREQEAFREAAMFLVDNATEAAADTRRFVPLSAEDQRAFEKRFRDRSDAPIIYDPWTPQGDAIEQSAANHRDIIAYALTLTPEGERAILTASLGIYYVPDAEIDWPRRRWARSGAE